jgi:hypothetical protein
VSQEIKRLSGLFVKKLNRSLSLVKSENGIITLSLAFMPSIDLKSNFEFMLNLQLFQL